MKLRTITIIALLTAYGVASPAFATTPTESAMTIAQSWAQIKYGMSPDAQGPAMEALKKQADSVAASNPGKAETLIWDGIVTSTLASIKGGLGGLSLAKEARSLLEKAEKIDPNALDGSVHTSLGALYYQVPGFPIGFGSTRKAREHLETALKIAPHGIDANYFWADFMYSQGEYAEAAKALKVALAAPGRPGREAADAGRRAEVERLLALATEKLKG